jgi:hypothetical protein
MKYGGKRTVGGNLCRLSLPSNPRSSLLSIYHYENGERPLERPVNRRWWDTVLYATLALLLRPCDRVTAGVRTFHKRRITLQYSIFYAIITYSVHSPRSDPFTVGPVTRCPPRCRTQITRQYTTAIGGLPPMPIAHRAIL